MFHSLYISQDANALQIGYTLNLRNQEELKNIAKDTAIVTTGLRDLTENTVGDSAIIRVITIVSAVYLPGSFVGVSN
jgi:hypothetical protein